MGRSKSPEQTLEMIIDTSTRLFIEKGYEQTSIQDILDALQLSKGGLYHHFKSKEEILKAAMSKRAQHISEMLNDIIRNTEAENAKEKLRKILKYILTDKQTHMLDNILAAQAGDPYQIVNGIQNCVNIDAPIISRLIEDGVKDGSLQTPQPRLCAEVFLLLLNFWSNPVLFGRNATETRDRLDYLQSMMRLLGLDIMDEELIALLMKSCDAMLTYSNLHK